LINNIKTTKKSSLSYIAGSLKTLELLCHARIIGIFAHDRKYPTDYCNVPFWKYLSQKIR
jgi:hypothetical protein